VTALFGIGYTLLLQLPAAPPLAGSPGTARLLGLTVLAAPLCEEFIFRGLLQGGLRRSLPAWQAITVAAAFFAIVHPPASMLPVFVLGLCTGWRTSAADRCWRPCWCTRATTPPSWHSIWAGDAFLQNRTRLVSVFPTMTTHRSRIFHAVPALL
jgi:hypothetical protein